MDKHEEEFVGLRAKTCSCLKDNNNEEKKGTSTRKFKFQDCKTCLEAAQAENKTNHLEKKQN